MPTQPNILFLFSDEHSFRYLGCLPEEQGGEPVHTPTLDKLASQGTRFSNAYCQMPLCTPSRLCTLSGRYVQGAGAWDNGVAFNPELESMPSALAKAGYETCLVGKMHLGGNRQFIGFQHRPYGDLTGSTGHQWEPLQSPERFSIRVRTEHAGITEIPESLIQDQVVAHETVAFVREHAARKPDTPWFLCASFSRPHFPLTVPERHLKRYWPNGVTEPPVPASGDAYDHPMSVSMRKGFEADSFGHDEMLKARAAYFGSVTYLDEVIGDLLLRLESDGLLDNTVIVYTTDHGEMAGEHGVWWKNGWYEACTHIPMIISTPAQRRGEAAATLCNDPVGLIDLYPTFCSLAGTEGPADLDGTDLTPALTGKAALPRRALACDMLTKRWGAGNEFRMLRLGAYKYVHFRAAPPLLFNLENDPGEQHNLVHSSDPEDCAALAELRTIAENTVDFNSAEEERVASQAECAERQLPDHDKSSGNLYMMPSGRLVNAEDALYAPTVITDDPASFFGDYPRACSGACSGAV